MEKILKSEMDLLIEKGVLKCVKGRYPGLISGSKQSMGKIKVDGLRNLFIISY
ncbi:hypothetical protein Dhaf_1447 [Desulfitobacterium hafniense DCB-2]|uniref:Uncharacterized protein n=1 Tax=Desulfitobacterium hafniense (strain DSM 10664 / DCB-2) TaxID=272564 RepID=B8FNX5_DESHD|nr:hypothetical protein [Desulfitobacterium hafniense]ACL19500.1 hypothetical protein Dhaf_1447 [Desulfitobacterium hafniense DCB-2]